MVAQEDRGNWLAAGLSPRRVLVVAALFIIAYFGVSIVGNAITRHELAREQERLQADIERLEAQQAQLDALRTFMQSDEFIERAARDQGLVRPGDTSVIVVAPTAAATAAASVTGPWWERYFGDDGR
jgi:cell division protein FtsB